VVVVCLLFWVFLWWFLVVGVVFGGFQDFSRFLAITQDFFQFSSWRILGCFLFKGFFVGFLVKELIFGGFQDFSRLHLFFMFYYCLFRAVLPILAGILFVFYLIMVYNGFLVKGTIFGGFQDCVLEFLERSKAYAKGLVWRVSKIFPSANEPYAGK